MKNTDMYPKHIETTELFSGETDMVTSELILSNGAVVRERVVGALALLNIKAVDVTTIRLMNPGVPESADDIKRFTHDVRETVRLGEVAIDESHRLSETELSDEIAHTLQESSLPSAMAAANQLHTDKYNKLLEMYRDQMQQQPDEVIDLQIEIMNQNEKIIALEKSIKGLEKDLLNLRSKNAVKDVLIENLRSPNRPERTDATRRHLGTGVIPIVLSLLPLRRP